MTRLSLLQRRNLRRRRQPPAIHWTHALGVLLGLIPLAVILHHNHVDSCSPLAWEACRRG